MGDLEDIKWGVVNIIFYSLMIWTQNHLSSDVFSELEMQLEDISEPSSSLEDMSGEEGSAKAKKMRKCM